MPCCKRTDRSKRRRNNKNKYAKDDEFESADPVGNHLGDFPQAPNQEQSGEYSVSLLQPDQAIICPMKGKGALKRVFLGIGWKSKEKVDVDCVAAAFSKGIRDEESTVYYGNLNGPTEKIQPTGSKEKAQDYCSIKHSGDVLIGQNDYKELKDLERIYVNLDTINPEFDCIAFEANVYSGGKTFADLDSAYVRLCNADTSQEICRCDISKDSPLGKQILSQRVLLLAKLMRGKDRWVLHCCTTPRPLELNKVSGPQPEFSITEDAVEEVDDTRPPSMAGKDSDTTPDNTPEKVAKRANTSKKRARKPSNTFMIGACGIATAAAVVAGIAIFKPEALSAASMGASELAGDIAGFASANIPTDCGCCADFVCCECFNPGEVAGEAADFVCGGCCSLVGIPFECPISPNDICGICEPVSDLCAGGCDQVFGLLEGCGLGGDVCNLCGDCGGIAPQIGETLCGCLGGCGDVSGSVLEAAEGLVSVLPAMLEGVFSLFGGVLDAVLS